MAITHGSPVEMQSERVVFGEPARPYKDVAATVLADILEAQYGLKPPDEEIVFELLHRALDAEDAFNDASRLR